MYYPIRPESALISPTSCHTLLRAGNAALASERQVSIGNPFLGSQHYCRFRLLPGKG